MSRFCWQPPRKRPLRCRARSGRGAAQEHRAQVRWTASWTEAGSSDCDCWQRERRWSWFARQEIPVQADKRGESRNYDRDVAPLGLVERLERRSRDREAVHSLARPCQVSCRCRFGCHFDQRY